MVEGVDGVVGISVHNADKGRGARVVEGEHHVIVDFAGLALDLNLEDALQFDVSARLCVFGCVGGGLLNMRMSGLKKG